MLNKKRVIGAMVLATAVLMSACGGGSSSSVYGELTENDKLIEAKVKDHQYPYAEPGTRLKIGKTHDACVPDFETNAFSLYLEEKTGLELDFEVYADSNSVKTMLAANSDDLPDIAVSPSLSDADFIQYGVGDYGTGAVVPWDYYYENYGYYYKQAVEQTIIDKIDNFLIAADGHRYTVPYICEQMGNVFSGKAFINKVWLDKLGLEVPTTTEELRTVLEAFRDKDPNGNGQKDEIPMTGSANGYTAKPHEFLLNAFVYCDRDNYMWADDKGNVSYIYTSDDYKEGLKYISDLCKDGLLDKQALIQKNDELKAISCANTNRIGVLIGGSPDNVFSAKLERMLDYVPLPVPKGPKGINYPYMKPIKPTNMGWMSRKCEHPLAGYALFDFMMSEEATTFARYGIEGKRDPSGKNDPEIVKDWYRATTDEEKDRALFKHIGFEGDIVTILGYGTITNSHWQAQNPQYRSSKIADGMVWDGNPLNGEYVKAQAITPYYLEEADRKEIEKHIVRALKFENLEDQKNYSTLASSLKTYFQQQQAKFIVGDLDVEKDWDAFQADLKTLKIDECLRLAQKGYDYLER